MERILKWLLPALILVEIILVRGGVLSIGQAVLVVVVIEGALGLVAVRQAFAAVRRFRAGRRAGDDPWTAAEDALAVFFPRVVARFMVIEPRLWACLARWATRRYRPGPDDFPYHTGSILGLFLILLIFTTPVEILLFEVLIPWTWLRWVVLVLAIYALVWVFGLYASLVVLPHRLEVDGLRLRYGVLNEVLIPYDGITDVREARRKSPGGGDGLTVREEDGGTAYLSVGGRTHVTLALSRPVQFRSLGGLSQPTSLVHVSVNQPDRLAAALRDRLTASRDEEPEAQRLEARLY